MNRSDVEELHYITPIQNVLSILEHGILCNRKARELRPVDVAMREIQAIRAGKKLPNGRFLHDYANLYFHARNPMMYKRRDLQLCVLRISPEVLDQPDVVIADGNAASNYTAFWPSPSGLKKIDKELVFAESWTDSNEIQRHHKRRVKCAEVLVPEKIDSRFITGVYVSSEEAKQKLQQLDVQIPVIINRHLFFK